MSWLKNCKEEPSRKAERDVKATKAKDPQDIYRPFGMLRRIFDPNWTPATNGKEDIFREPTWISRMRH